VGVRREKGEWEHEHRECPNGKAQGPYILAVMKVRSFCAVQEMGAQG